MRKLQYETQPCSVIEFSFGDVCRPVLHFTEDIEEKRFDGRAIIDTVCHSQLEKVLYRDLIVTGIVSEVGRMDKTFEVSRATPHSSETL